MKIKYLFLASVIFLVGFPAYSYDNFDSNVLDLSKWQLPIQEQRRPQERLREIVSDTSGSYLLFEERFTGGYGDNNARTNLLFSDASSVSSISVPIYVEAMESTGDTTTRFRLFMDHLQLIDGTPGGRLEVMIDVEKSADGPLQARYYIGRCMNDQCSQVDDLVFESGFVPVFYNTWHTLGLSWSSEGIAFSLDGFEDFIDVPDGMVLTTLPEEQSWVFLGSRFRNSNTVSDSGYLRVRVGEISVNGDLYEDFSGDRLNSENWLNPELFKRIVKDGQLSMRVAVDSADTPRQINQLRVTSAPEPVSKLSADIRVNGVNYTGDMRARARLAGNWFNTGIVGPGEVGDVFADIALYVDGDTLKGRAFAYVCQDEICNDGVVIFNDSQLGPFNFGQFYQTSIEWTGEEFLYQIGHEFRAFTPSGVYSPVAEAKFPYQAIGVRTLGSVGSADIDATFDNVLLNAPSLGYHIFSNDEKLLFVPSTRRSGEVDLITTVGDNVTLSFFDIDRSIIDFSILLSSLHNQNQLAAVRFETEVISGDLSLQINNTSTEQRLAEVLIINGAHLDLEDININFSARVFSDWYFPAIKALVGEDNIFNYTKGFSVANNGLISHEYDLGDVISIAVSGTIVDADGEYENLIGESVSGVYHFKTDISQGIDEFSEFSNSIYDPKYSLRSDQGLASANFNQSEFSSFSGVSVGYEPSFNWLDDFDLSDPDEISQSDDWLSLVSYMRYPKGDVMIPGQYGLLEFNAFTTDDSGVDPETGESIGVKEGVEMLLFAATDSMRPFEDWLDWFPNQSDFIVLVGQKLDDVSPEGDEVMLGQFFVKLDEVTISSGSYEAQFNAGLVQQSRRRSGVPIWLPAIIQ